MRRDISIQEAKAICGQIRARKYPVALFSTPVGIEIKRASQVPIEKIGYMKFRTFIGIYDKKVNYWNIYDDWNEI